MAQGLATRATVLDVGAFAAMVGQQPVALPPRCQLALAAANLDYAVITGREREARLLEALRASGRTELQPSGPHRAADWERGWNENLRAFEAQGFAPQALIPRYNKYDVVRLSGDYVAVADKGFEYAVYTALRHYCFARWFGGLSAVTEFGCGTGTSLALLAEAMPGLRLLGCDWAPSSQAILNRLGARLGVAIEARRFDMFAPDPALTLGPGTGVFTAAAMEQLGGDHHAFVDYLLAQQPEVCVHLEPIHEFYGEDDLFDEVASRYHRHRNYLDGFLTRLRALAAAGRIELLEQRRTGLGSFFHEGYGLVVWRPTPAGGSA